MKVHELISVMQAGGPGSGRRPGDVLHESGWKIGGRHISTGSWYSHPNLKGHTISVGKNDRSWKHEDMGTKVASGKNVDSLVSHLSSIKAFALSTGDQVVGYMDVRPTFHPPSLKKPYKIPVDQPGETDDRFLDVTKRKSKETESRRRQLHKNSTGQPTRVTTTIAEPGTYIPTDLP